MKVSCRWKSSLLSRPRRSSARAQGGRVADAVRRAGHDRAARPDLGRRLRRSAPWCTPSPPTSPAWARPSAPWRSGGWSATTRPRPQTHQPAPAAVGEAAMSGQPIDAWVEPGGRSLRRRPFPVVQLVAQPAGDLLDRGQGRADIQAAAQLDRDPRPGRRAEDAGRDLLRLRLALPGAPPCRGLPIRSFSSSRLRRPLAASLASSACSAGSSTFDSS